MNKSVEIINENLFAVKFSLLPFIDEIGYKPDKTAPAYTEPCRLSDDGKMILNKDHQGYEILRNLFLRFMQKTNKDILKEIKDYQKKGRDVHENLCYAVLVGERERRVKTKVWRL